MKFFRVPIDAPPALDARKRKLDKKHRKKMRQTTR